MEVRSRSSTASNFSSLVRAGSGRNVIVDCTGTRGLRWQNSPSRASPITCYSVAQYVLYHKGGSRDIIGEESKTKQTGGFD